MCQKHKLKLIKRQWEYYVYKCSDCGKNFYPNAEKLKNMISFVPISPSALFHGLKGMKWGLEKFKRSLFDDLKAVYVD